MMDYRYLRMSQKRASSAKAPDRNTWHVFEGQCGGQCVWRGEIKERRGENEGGERKRWSVSETEQRKTNEDVLKVRGSPKIKEG